MTKSQKHKKGGSLCKGFDFIKLDNIAVLLIICSINAYN